MQTKLLADTVRKLTQQVPPTKETTLFDTLLPRFALRVRPPIAPGRPWASSYFVRYVGPGGRERKHVIGSPATMDLDAARKAARKVLAVVDQGGDPGADKTARREAWTVRMAVDRYLDSPEFRRKTTRTRSTETASARLHITHHLGTLALATVNVPDVKRLLRLVEHDKRTNKRQRRLGGVGAARKTARVLSAILSWCVDQGQLARNPMIGAIRLAGDGTRETVLTEADQYARLFTAADDLVAADTLRPAARAFITVAALTGMRRGELQGLYWRDVDLAERRITLTMTKGAKLARSGMKTETVSLPPFAAAALAGIRSDEATADDLVFLPVRGVRFSIHRDWHAVRAKADLPADLTLHGLRHSVGTVAIMAGMSTAEVQKLLRHRGVGTTAKYIHLADRARLTDRAMAGMAPEPAEAAEPEPAEAAHVEVTELHRRRG